MRALIIIDMQKALCGQDPLPFAVETKIANINRLKKAATATKLPVILIQHEAPGTALERGSTGWQITDAIDKVDTDLLLSKTTTNAFHNTLLNDLLVAAGVKHLLITGYASEFCVDTTFRAAAALGYDITLVSDAHTTHDKRHATAADIIRHENATLPELLSFGVRLQAVTTGDVVLSVMSC